MGGPVVFFISSRSHLFFSMFSSALYLHITSGECCFDSDEAAQQLTFWNKQSHHPCLSVGGLDQGRRQRHSGHARPSSDQQRPAVGPSQRLAHVDATHQRRPPLGPGRLHVPNQLGPDAQPGKIAFRLSDSNCFKRRSLNRSCSIRCCRWESKKKTLGLKKMFPVKSSVNEICDEKNHSSAVYRLAFYLLSSPFSRSHLFYLGLLLFNGRGREKDLLDRRLWGGGVRLNG